uniref:Uncharacterized protein n=1 Tax=Ixodes ricinus TaxID=34613 RepID=A0A0K8RKP4_IXORI
MAAVRPASESGARDLRVRFTLEDDLNILAEVNASNPFEHPHKWLSIAKNVGNAAEPRKLFTARSVQERCDLLLAYFQACNGANRRKWGTGDQNREKVRLLGKISARARSFGYKVKQWQASNISQLQNLPSTASLSAASQGTEGPCGAILPSLGPTVNVTQKRDEKTFPPKTPKAIQFRCGFCYYITKDQRGMISHLVHHEDGRQPKSGHCPLLPSGSEPCHHCNPADLKSLKSANKVNTCLRKYGCGKHKTTCHKKNKKSRAPRTLQRLEQGNPSDHLLGAN